MFVGRTLKIYSCNNFQVYNTVLLIIVTTLYTISSELIPLIAESLYYSTNISPFPLLPTSRKPPFYSVSLSLTFLGLMYKRGHTFFLSFWLISLSILEFSGRGSAVPLGLFKLLEMCRTRLIVWTEYPM